MMKRILSIGLAAVLLLSAGCTKKGGTSAAASGAANTVTYPAAISEEDYEAQWKVREDNPVKDETIASLNAFAQSSAEKLLTNAGQNENYSPLSLYYALTLLANGASGETKANLESVLHTEDAAAMAKELGNLLRMLYRDNKAAKLKIANSLWMQNDVQFQDAFKATATDDLYASLFNVDFTDETTVDKMIAWIRENTSNLEPSFSLDPETIMAIINTIDYRAAWYDEFMKEKNEKLPFHTLAGDIDAEYMTQKKEFTTYYRGDGFARATLRLAEGGEMIFVLPDENTTLSELLSRENALSTLLEGGESRDADITYRIPKFRFSSDFDLAPLIKALGAEDIFTERADFSAMTAQPAAVSQIKQQSFIEVNEKGVAASAYTMIDAMAMGLPPEGLEQLDFTLNRPFLYAITADGGALMFVGTVYAPSMD